MNGCRIKTVCVGLAVACAVGAAAVSWSAEPSSVTTSSGAYVFFMKGDVAVRSAGGAWQPARVGQSLQIGDEVRVGDGAYAELAYDRNHTTVSRLDKAGTVVIEAAGAEGVRVRLKQGRLFNVVAPLQTGQHFVVQTPEAVASVRGTVFEGDRAPETGTLFAVYDQGDPQAHEVVTQAVDASGRSVGEERVIGEGLQTEIKEGRVAEPAAVPTEKVEAAREMLQEVERHAQEPPTTERQSTTQGPPPGAPPTGQANAPTVGGSPERGPGAAAATAGEHAPPSDAMKQEMASKLGVTPEALDQMTPQQREEFFHQKFQAEGPGLPGPAGGPDERHAAEHAAPPSEHDIDVMSEMLGVRPDELKTMPPEQIAERMEQRAAQEAGQEPRLTPEERQRMDAEHDAPMARDRDALEHLREEPMPAEHERMIREEMERHAEDAERYERSIERREITTEQRQEDWRRIQETMPPPSPPTTEGSATSTSPPPPPDSTTMYKSP